MNAVRDGLGVISSIRDASDDDVVNRLALLGYSASDAGRLNAFLPSACAWALLGRMGVASFPHQYIALSESGADVNVPSAHEHYFTAALTLAFETLEGGWDQRLSRQEFEAVIARSTEMSAANKPLNAGESLDGASAQPRRVFCFFATESADTSEGSDEWDPIKATDNVAKHGISFEEAATVFDDPLYVDFYDPDHSLEEHRYIVIGTSKQGRLLMDSYTERTTTIRIISSRELTAKERKAYEQG